MTNSHSPQLPRLNRGGFPGCVLLGMAAIGFSYLPLPSAEGLTDVTITAQVGTGYALPPGSFNLTLSPPPPTESVTLIFTLSGVATSRYTVAYAGDTLSPTSNSESDEALSIVLAPTDWDTDASTTKVITVNPLETLRYEPNATLTLTVQPSPSYPFPSLSSASIPFNGNGAVAISAVIISGASDDPWKLVDPGQALSVTIKGGLVALGSPQASPTPSPSPMVSPTPGPVQLVADANLLDGISVPPIVPTVMDVHIHNSQITSSTERPVTTTGGPVQPTSTPTVGPTPKPIAAKPTPF